jgi:hypothetical protein
MRRIAFTACILACAAPAAFAAAWAHVRSSAGVSLLVDSRSIARKGDQVSLSYLIDYAKPQGDRLLQLTYRSSVTSAKVRCKARTVSLGATELYSGPKATGVLMATANPNERESAFNPVEKGTSDEDLWRHACEKKPEAKKP